MTTNPLVFLIPFINQKLNELFPNPPIPLDHSSPYTLLVAVLLSAQCTDERVNTVTPKLFSMANTAEKMSTFFPEDILPIIRPCGLGPQKSKAIIGLSQILKEKYEGKVPSSLEELEQLPGVGRKTANVVLAQIFNIPSFPVDTHIHRLAQRWHLSSGKNVLQTEKDLKSFFPENRWNTLHLQMIYYGRKFCPARTHQLSQCSICQKVAEFYD